MRKPVYLLIVGMLAVSVLQITLPSFNFDVEASPPPPNDLINGTQYIEGDWYVNGTESYTNETIVLSGNLIINSGASLTLRNVTLAMNCSTENGTYEIIVWGTLDISDYDDDPSTTSDRSNITDSPFDVDDRSGNDYKYAIKVWEFASLSIENTIIREAGFSNSDNNVGFYIESGNNVNIQNCTFENGFYGIYLWRGSNIKISHTEIKNNIHWGIEAPWVQNLYLFNNEIHHNDFGLQLWSGNSILANNYIHNNTQYYTPDTDHHGVEWWYGDNLQIYNNTFENNGGSMYATHLEIWGCDNVQMYNNTFTKLKPGSFASVYIGEHSDMNFHDNTIINNPGTALRFNFAGSTSNNKYYNNNISNNLGVGVFFDSWGDGSESVTFQFKNNLLYKNGMGMRLQELRTYDISNNVIEMCTNDGIYVNDVYGGLFTNNSITSGDSDFYLTDSYDIQDTVLKVLNCSFDTFKVDLNNNAELVVQNYLHLYVTDATSWVPGATIEVRNNTGVLTFTGLTDDTGRIKFIVVENMTMTVNGNVTYDPYNITATLDIYTAYGEIEPVMDKSKTVNVIFSDDLPPTPPSGLTSVSNGTNVDLEWVSSPSTDVDHYLVYRNATGPVWDIVYNSSLFPGYELHTNWTDPKAASDWSTYYYYVVAVDAAGNPSEPTNIAFCGDWVVDSTLSYSDFGVFLNGSLIILPTGNLTIKNVKIKFNNTIDTVYGIEVLANGSFWILDGDNNPLTTGDMSEIAGTLNKSMYFVMNGAEFVMRNSKLSYCGLNDGLIYGSWTFNVEAPNVMSVGDPWTRGLYIGSPGATITIENNQFTNNFVTILIDNVNDCTITGNEFSDNTFGLYIFNSHFNQINGNTFTNHQAFSVYMRNSGDHVITYNEFDNTNGIQAGLMLYGNDCLNNDIFYNNFTGDFKGIFIYDGGDDNNISHNYFYTILDGIQISYTSQNTVMDNHYFDVSGTGTTFQNVGFSTISGEDMNQVSTGYSITSSSNILVSDLVAENVTTQAIFSLNTNFIQINDVSIESDGYGIVVSGGFTITIIDITIKDTNTGIFCKSDPANLKLVTSTISDNTVTAIEADTCTNFIITNCTLDATLYNFDLIDAEVILYNTTYNQTRVLLNPSSSITLFWYIKIHVRDWFDNPVSGANVQIRKPLGTLVFNEFTNSNGDTRWFFLLERTQYAFSNETSTPYFIQAFNGTHSGSVEFWLNQSTIVTVMLENIAPSVSNAIISPSLPTTVDDLMLSYTYTDPENDPEGSTMIIWYTDGIHNTTFNNQTEINQSYTTKGQTWFCEIIPHDGAIYGIPMVSTPVSIQNTPPVVENVTIVQTAPTSSDYLNVAYNFTDIDNDFEGQSQYRWHFWDGIGWTYSGVDSLELDPSNTAKGDLWKCVVTPHDGDDLGNPVDSNIVTIGNSAPEVSDVTITPLGPTSDDSLIVSYFYFDLDSDPETGSMIRWYKNGTEQPALENSTSVDSSLTLKGEIWFYTVTPHDGEDYGITLMSDPKTIDNTPPTVSNITITPITPTTEDDLNVSYDYFDIDGDPESLDTIVRWLRWNGMVFFDTGLRGKTLPSEHTSKGENWTCEVIPHDGWNEGTPTLSDMNVTIVNSAPFVINVFILPENPISISDLLASYQYVDLDFDFQSGSLIRWYQNDVEQTDLNDSMTVSASRVQKGDVWYYIVTPSDGEDFGVPVQSENTTIGNTPPLVSNITISPVAPDTEDVLTVSYDFFDIDGDSESLDTVIKWLRWSGADFFDTGHRGRNLSAEITFKGEIWTCEVIPHDGEDEGLANRSDMNVTIINSAPVILSAEISPENPNSVSNLTATFQYYDVDSDPESGSTISWYRNDIEQVPLAGNFMVDASNTLKGDVWHYIINPYDGEDFGTPFKSENATIGNTPPSVSNITISPLTPDTEDVLTVSYDFFDIDGDSESLDTVIKWLRWSVSDFFDTGHRGRNLSADLTLKGEIWTCEVIPHDGEDEGVASSSDMNVTVVNSPPSILSAYITPTNPTAASNLSVSYVYYDVDGDSELGGWITWFQNDVEQLDLNGSYTVNFSRTQKGDVWYYVITPFDETDYGASFKSDNTTIGNTPPTVSNITISPMYPNTEDVLTVSYDFNDTDGDSESLDTVVKWLRWSGSDFFDTGHRGKNLSSIHTARDEIWTCEVVPHDGLNEGTATRSSMNVTINNTVPSVLSASISPSNPTSDSDLTASYIYDDMDSDPESGSAIRWFKDDVEQVDQYGNFTINYSKTTPGEIWYYMITPSDGMGYGAEEKSANVTIGNTPPYVTNITISPLIPDTLDDLTVTYDYYDSDGNNESLNTVVRWLRWDVNKFIDTGLRGKTLSSDYTAQGDIWTCEVVPHDGLDEGAATQSDMNVTIGNTEPSILSASITPSEPPSGSNLTSSYNYFDVDGDSESGSMIRWYKDDVEQWGLNDSFTVNSLLTQPGETWYYIITPSDGMAFGVSVISENVTIGNTPPYASNITISPSNPDTGDDLTVTYNYYDVEGNSESLDTVVRWLRWDIDKFIDTGHRGKTLSSDYTARGETWTCEIIPHDGLDEGAPTRSDMNVTIQNTVPTVLSAVIFPSSPNADSDISAGYNYYDVDGDFESGSTISWFQNDVEQLDLYGNFTVNYSRTLKGDIWYYIITPSDGLGFETPFKSDNKTIGNTPPYVTNITISPVAPTTEDDLSAAYDYYDSDGDSESLDTVVKWLRWSGSDFFDTGHRGKTLSSALTAKGEIWTCEVVPHDGGDEGSAARSDMNVTIGNSAPSILDAQITPANPTAADDLDAGYTYYDVDSDTESGSMISWFRNGIEQTDLNGSLSVNSARTQKGDTWYYIITPSDGEDFGAPVQSDTSTIGNTPPQVSNIAIAPLTPSTGDDLVASYVYFDSDGDTESLDTTVKWLLWSGITFIDTGYRGKTLSSTHTSKGDIWSCEVIPHDGEDEGSVTQSSMNVTIINSAPAASDAVISPTDPTSDEDLTAVYDYSDVDLDTETGSIIRWFRNGIEQVDLLDSFSVNFSRTQKGEGWYYTITPYDGEDYGASVQSDPAIIGNTPPSVLNITITPLNPTTQDDLTVTYDFNDGDGDSESLDTTVRWLRWSGTDFVDTGFRGKTLSSSQTSKGELWTCEISPHDGVDSGATVTSGIVVTILNSKPTASNLYITPQEPTGGNDLTANYVYYDLDSDPESGSEIMWFRDGSHIQALDNQSTVPSSMTAKGQTWNFSMHPNDNFEFGDWVGSEAVTIQNTPPSATNLTISPNPPLGEDDLLALYTFTDDDGDSEAGYEIKWYKNVFVQELYSDQLLVDSTATGKDELWSFTLRVYDGEDWSETLTSHYVVIENSRPIINSISPSDVTQEISEPEHLEFFVDAEDPDDDLLIYRWKLGKTTVGSDDYYLFETDYESEGVYTLNLTVQDFGERSYSQYYEWVITVNNVNRLPELEVTEPLTKTPKMEEDTSLRFLIDVTDSDTGDILDIIWYFDDVVAQEGGSSYTYHADFAAAGDHEVKAVVDDGTDSTEYSWNFTVADIAQEAFLGYSYDWWGLVLAIGSGVAALLLAFIGLMRVKKKKGALKKYMAEIDELSRDTTLSPEEYEEKLSDIEARINDEFKQGLIEDLHYLMLQDLVASKRGEARKAEVSSMFGRLPAGVVRDLDNMLKDGKISPEEYEGFVATISMTESLTPEEKEDLSKVIEKWGVEDEDITSQDSQSVKDKIIKDELDELIDDIETSDD